MKSIAYVIGMLGLALLSCTLIIVASLDLVLTNVLWNHHISGLFIQSWAWQTLLVVNTFTTFLIAGGCFFVLILSPVWWERRGESK